MSITNSNKRLSILQDQFDKDLQELQRQYNEALKKLNEWYVSSYIELEKRHQQRKKELLMEEDSHE